MIEYNDFEKTQSLVNELRQYPVSMISPNIADYATAFSDSTLLTREELKALIETHGYVVVRGFSNLKNDAVSLALLLSNEIFFQGTELRYVHDFETEPFQTEIFSSSLESGAFHTDFWSLKNTPNFVMIQCVEPDPRHPFYSRNQVVTVSNLILRIEELFPGANEILLNCVLPHRVGNKTLRVNLLSQHESKLMIRLHPKYVDESSLEKDNYIGNVPIHVLISDIGKSIADDFVLDSGDILIASNKFCLHRRGESTVSFRSSIFEWTGRKINTLRFF